MSRLTKQFAAALFPRYSRFLDLVNHNAKMAAWLRAIPPSVPVLPDRFALYAHLGRHVLGEEAIDYLEFGVFKGTTMRAWSELNTKPKSRFVGFDSFEGLPEDWTGDFGAGAFDVAGQLPQIADPRVAFVKGWFQHTVPGFLAGFTPANRLVIHNDSDLYSSTLYTLCQIDKIIVSGSIIIFDEFTSPLHEFRAFNDYLGSFMRTARPIAMTEAGGGQGRGHQIAFIFD